jgi:amino acid transporter
VARNPTASGDAPVPRKQLSLFDSTCLIVGIIIGVGIYQTAPDVAKGAGSWWAVLVLWLLGGVLSLCGALGYAELASAYPRQGGDYVYLSRSYGRWAGFLFGWTQLAIVRPGDIAVVAFAFATYARALYDPLAGSAFPYAQQIYAAVAVLGLTAINIMGVRQGKWTQNVLTTVKVLGLVAVVGVALAAPMASAPAAPTDRFPASIAMILVLFTFGGWNEMAYVAAEVRNPHRNIVRALVSGTAAVTVVYILANGSFLWALGHGGMAGSEAVATDAVRAVFPRIGGRLIAALVCISALGAVNGMVFAGARISYAVGAEHAAFRPLGKWDPRTGTPLRALLLQAVIAIGLIVLLGSFVDTLLYTAAAVYTFYLATSVSVFVLRMKEPKVERPYRVTWFPLPTIVFCLVCSYLIYSAIAYKPWLAIISLALIPLGLPIYLLSESKRS